MKSVYINGAACISPQNSLDKDFLNTLTEKSDQKVINAVEPVYKEFIPPAQIRRMSKAVKMSSVASQLAIQEAGITNPDAIIVGTGMGCSQDSEKFLKNLLENNEEFLTPTFFIQSTHNTVAGQIALALQCHAYNFTYVNTSSSLEFSFLDAKLQIEDGEAQNILVGAVDEQTKRTLELYELAGIIKNEEILPDNFLQSNSKGVIWGEGAAFFVVGEDKTEHSYAKIADIKITNRIEKAETLSFIESFLEKNNLKPQDIDAVILGNNGDQDSDEYYREASKIFNDSSLMYYKHLSGEFNTSSGFSTFLACNILKNQEIPSILKMNGIERKEINNILIYNHLLGEDHSVILLERP